MNDGPDPSAVNARIVYWGAEGAGKRTNLRVIHAKLRPDHRGELRWVPTRLDPTVSYATLPIELGEVGGVRTRIQIVAVPGEREHAPTRKQLLDRADGVVLVLDARRERQEENLASFEELKRTLAAYGRRVEDTPLVVQYNKRDLADPYALEDLHRKLAMRGVAAFEAAAKDGTGVLQTLTTISKRVIRHLRERRPGDAEPAPAAARSPGPARPSPTAGQTPPAATSPPPSPSASPAPGVTQLIDRAEFEASLARPSAAARRPEAARPAEGVVSPEDSQPGYEAPPATYADPVVEAQTLFDGEFEAAKRAAAAPDKRAPRGAADVAPGLAIEQAGPAQPAPDGLRIPLIVRDGNGKPRKLTLSLRFEREDA